MTDIDQDIPKETLSQSDGELAEEANETPVVEPEGSDIASETVQPAGGENHGTEEAVVAEEGVLSRPSDHTPESSKIQAEASAEDQLGQRLSQRIADVSNLLSERERQLLLYVYHDVPKPYYDRWKSEANAIFALRVRLKQRQELAAKAKKSAR